MKMIEVVMRTTAAGPGGVWPAGARVRVEEGVARAWIAGGFAEPVEKEKERRARVEEGTREALEQAVGARERGQ